MALEYPFNRCELQSRSPGLLWVWVHAATTPEQHACPLSASPARWAAPPATHRSPHPLHGRHPGFDYAACLAAEKAKQWAQYPIPDISIDLGATSDTDYELFIYGWPRHVDLAAQLQVGTATAPAPFPPFPHPTRTTPHAPTHPHTHAAAPAGGAGAPAAAPLPAATPLPVPCAALPLHHPPHARRTHPALEQPGGYVG